MELFEAADLFGIERLKRLCEQSIMSNITMENAAAIFQAADMHHAQILRDNSVRFILQNFDEVSKVFDKYYTQTYIYIYIWRFIFISI